MTNRAMMQDAFRRVVSPPPELMRQAILEAMEAARPRTAEEEARAATPKIDAGPVAAAQDRLEPPTAGEIARELAADVGRPQAAPGDLRFAGDYRRSWLKLIVPPRLWRYCYGNPPRYGVDFEKEALKSLSHRIILGHLINEMDAGRWPSDLRDVAMTALLAERAFGETIHKVNAAMKRVQRRAP